MTNRHIILRLITCLAAMAGGGVLIGIAALAGAGLVAETMPAIEIFGLALVLFGLATWQGIWLHDTWRARSSRKRRP